MAATRTFSIIKPDATRRNLTGAVNTMIDARSIGAKARAAVSKRPPERQTRPKLAFPCRRG